MRSLKKIFVSSILCLLLVFSAAFFSNAFNVESASAAGDLEGSGTAQSPYLISSIQDLVYFQQQINGGNSTYLNANFRLERSLDLGEIESWTPIGTTNEFKGTFDGNGKTIDNVNLKDGTELGLFANVNGAKISNLGLSVNVVLTETVNEGVVTPNSQTVVGGIAAIAFNSEISASYVKFNFKASRISRMLESNAQEFYLKIEGSEQIEEDENTTYEYETYSYMGELYVGAIAGKSISSTIANSYSIPSIRIFQDGTNAVSSFFGGIVGWAKGGTIENVYVAPTDSLVSSISSKNGNLSAVDAKDAAIVINTSKDNSSNVVFGGVVGLATEGGLVVQNTLFSSVVASLSRNKLVRGGIVGKISTNSSDWPNQIMYGKFLSIANAQANIMTFSSGVGNGLEVGYSLNSSVSATNSIPTQQMFKSWAWNEFRPWSEDVWKDTSTITSMGFYFPALQKFASFTITVSGSKEVAFAPSNSYLSGYYTLELSGITEKTYQYVAGQEVKIIARFYSEAGNQLRDFKNYFKFTTWVFGNSTIANLNYDGESTAQSGYNVTLNPETGETTITFIASSQTEGTYDVGIVGRPVTVNVSFRNKETGAKQENIGVITKKLGNEIQTYYEDFSFVIDEYLNKQAVTLTADASESGEYIFSNEWKDGNNTSRINAFKGIVVELDNSKLGEAQTGSKFYPTVISTSDGLVASVVAYFSNNTKLLSVSTKGEGKVKIGDSETSSYSEKIINGTTITLEAVAGEGMQFVGWFSGEDELSKELIYEFELNSETTIEARFEEIKEEKGGLPWWAITLIVGVPVVAGIIVTIVIVKVKGNSRKGYRKNYKF